jgi:N-acetylmuramic acid 6-phosphate (MurNAc-6-P) etherase
MNERITEKSNGLTENIDILEIKEILKIFRQVDSQIFNGYYENDSIKEENLIEKYKKISKIYKKIINNNKKHHIIFSGAGTSGKIKK